MLTTLMRELTKPAGRPILHRPVVVERRGASAGHRLCEFQKSWHRPGVVRRADVRTTPGRQMFWVVFSAETSHQASP